MKKRLLITIVAAAGMAGCVNPIREAREARETARADQQCKSFGAKPGTDAYIQCRVGLVQADNMSARAAPRNMNCSRDAGGNLNCNSW